jgi:hypothetical protein
LIETAYDVPGTSAMFTPLRKSAKTSLNSVLTYSLCSSDAKAYWKKTLPEVVEKLISSFTHSKVLFLGISALSAANPGVPREVPALPELFGPTAVATLPLDRMIPSEMPMELAPFENVPDATAAPVSVALLIVTPEPRMAFPRAVALLF